MEGLRGYALGEDGACWGVDNSNFEWTSFDDLFVECYVDVVYSQRGRIESNQEFSCSCFKLRNMRRDDFSVWIRYSQL